MGTAESTYDPRIISGDKAGGQIVARSRTPIATETESPSTTRARRIWAAGDYERIAAGFRHEGEAFIARLGVRAGSYVLDAACGSGNLTIPLARGGARVFGLDIAVPLLERARDWAAAEKLPVMLDEGTVEEMPYADGAFDVVTSMFGLMFAGRPELVAKELARVTKRGGTVALANWTKAGFVGKMLGLHVEYVAPPQGAPSTLLWADEGTLRQRFPQEQWDLRLTPRTLTFRYPHTPAGTAELFRGTYGPTVRTLEALGEDKRAEFMMRLSELWQRHQIEGVQGTAVESEYMEVIAIRR